MRNNDLGDNPSCCYARRLASSKATLLGVIGAGAEARAQIEAMHAIGLVESVHIFSRSPANRERLAAELGPHLGIDARAVGSAREAVDGAGIVVAAVKSTETVFEGVWLQPGMHVNSVGTARPDQREIDAETFCRSEIVIVDSRAGVFGEAGDAIAARDSIDVERVFELVEVVIGRRPGRQSENQITLFKSVGTAVQDVAMAACIFDRATGLGIGTDLGSFPMLKQS